MIKKVKYIFVFVVAVLFSCDYEFPEPEIIDENDLGTVNADKIVAIGDGFLAGAMDGSLYIDGQKNSVPAIITKQMEQLTTISFQQPLVDSENGYNFYASVENSIYGKWILKYQNSTAEMPERVLTSGEMVSDYSGSKAELNNLAVPLFSSGEFLLDDLNENIYAGRVKLSDNISLIDQIVEQSPTFVVCWIGMNDFLQYAIAGATNETLKIEPEVFHKNMETTLQELIENTECKIALANLIPINNLPYFYYNTYDNLFLAENKLGIARAKYYEFNQAAIVHNRNATEEEQRPLIDFFDNGVNPHPQPLVVTDNSLSDAVYPDGAPLEKFRQLSENEMVLLSISREMINEGYGWLIPLEEKQYLTEDKIQELSVMVESYNSTISQLVSQYSDRITLVDIKTGVEPISESGKTDAWGDPINPKIVYFNGVPVEGSLGLNSIFSLDGLHFNPRGNAFVANAFIRQINKAYDGQIPLANINDYIGNIYHF